MKSPPGFDDLFDHLAQLIDLDRKDAAVMTLVAEFVDCVLKREVHRLDAVAKQILESDYERKTQSSRPRFADDFQDIDASTIFLERFGNDVAFGVIGEISAAPGIDIVSRDRGINIPLVLHFSRATKSEVMRIIIHRGQHSSLRDKISLYGEIARTHLACFSSPCG